MTINQIREKLGSIVSHVFTDDFTKNFNMISRQIEPDRVEVTCIAYLRGTDAYIRMASDHCKDDAYLADLSTLANPLIVFSVFMRYHWITQYLVSRDQHEVRDVPVDDSQFFRSIMLDLWYEIVPEDKLKQSGVVIH